MSAEPNSEPNINVAEPLRYRGSSSRYVDIGTRNEGEFLGIAIDYSAHPSGVGCFILRFVAHGVEPGSLKHFAFRENASFFYKKLDNMGGVQQITLKGLRLNKVAVKAFSPAVLHHEVPKYAEQFGIYQTLTEWIADQLILEGFALTVDLAKIVPELITPPAKTTPGVIKSALEFPNLDSPEEKASAIKHKKSKPVEEDEDDEDEDDEDKDWMH